MLTPLNKVSSYRSHENISRSSPTFYNSVVFIEQLLYASYFSQPQGNSNKLEVRLLLLGSFHSVCGSERHN